jgi:hypothetical protein|tara:strand:+ start:267 stop:545 length:279 start_codon:yes stop_codon:yes gene_type:complete
MAFIEDFAEFFDTSDFAVEAIIGATTVNGILDEAYIEVAGIEGVHPTFACALADVQGVSHGASVEIGSATYHVIGIQVDGTGMVELVLEDQS